MFIAFNATAHAQSFSNLYTPTPVGGGEIFLNPDQGEAQAFVTGSDASGYALTNVQLEINTEGTPAGPMSVSIYTASEGSVGSLASNGVLSGNAFPSTGSTFYTDGIYTWEPENGTTVFLAPSTEYWIVASADTTANLSSEIYYEWNLSGTTPTATGGWSAPTSWDASEDGGASWALVTFPSGVPLSFSVSATDFSAAPEPSTWALLLGGLGLLAFWRGHPRRAFRQRRES